jgi:hypothetical protein
MMIKLFLASIAICCFVMSLAQASTTNRLKLTGYVTTFDDTAVTVESGTQRYTIPRAMYPDAIKAGELISVPMTQTEFASLKHVPTVKR